jgi:hypothetical protein
VLWLHVPPAIAPFLPSRFNLNCATTIADLISNDNIRVGNAGWRQSGNHPTAQELAHNIMFASGT